MRDRSKSLKNKICGALPNRKRKIAIGSCVAIVVVSLLFVSVVAMHQLNPISDSSIAKKPSNITGTDLTDQPRDKAEGPDNGPDAYEVPSEAIGPDPAENEARGTGSVITAPSDPEGGSSAPAQPSSPSDPQKTWIEDTERIWVVDRAAWTETIPVFESVERSICNICGADITGNTSVHNKQHMLNGEGSGYHSKVIQVQTGTKTVDHPEEGHWEITVIRTTEK